MARLAVGLLAAACLLLAAVPKARAGAVFEVREPVPTRDADYKFTFDQAQAGVTGGSIVRPTGPNAQGAGAVFAATSIPMARFTLNRCVSVAPHIHPNGAEFVYCLTGRLRVVQFRGEEDGTNVRTVDLQPGDAAYIGQGSVHFVVNTNRGPSSFLQLFDHPQAGTVFVASALVNLPRNVINSAFSRDILPASGNSITASPPPLIPIRQCPY